MSIGYGIGQKYRPIWVSVLVLDLNQYNGFSHTLQQRLHGRQMVSIKAVHKTAQPKKKIFTMAEVLHILQTHKKEGG